MTYRVTSAFFIQSANQDTTQTDLEYLSKKDRRKGGIAMIDRRVSEVMARSSDIRLTWGRAQAGMDLAELNAKSGGRWSWGRLRTVEAKGK